MTGPVRKYKRHLNQTESFYKRAGEENVKLEFGGNSVSFEREHYDGPYMICTFNGKLLYCPRSL